MLIQEHEFRDARHPLKPRAERSPARSGLASCIKYTLTNMMICMGKEF